MTQPALAYQRSLFLQALAAMQAAPWQDNDSYFQLAAIHGLPYMAYNGAINPAAPYVEGQTFFVLGEERQRDGGKLAALAGLHLPHASRHAVTCLATVLGSVNSLLAWTVSCMVSHEALRCCVQF